MSSNCDAGIGSDQGLPAARLAVDEKAVAPGRKARRQCGNAAGPSGGHGPAAWREGGRESCVCVPSAPSERENTVQQYILYAIIKSPKLKYFLLAHSHIHNITHDTL